MSLTTIKKISLDFYNNNIVMINEKQLDVGSRYVNVTCTENGKKFFVNPETMSAHIRYKKADGKDVFNDVEILEDGTLLVELTQQMLAVEGKHLADIILVSANGFSISDLIDLDRADEMGGSIISTMSFYINVLSAVVNSSDITSTDEFGFLEGALVKLASVNNELTNLMGDKTDDASKDTLYGVKAAAEDAVEYVENSKADLEAAINEANAAKDRADMAASNASEKASYAYEATEEAKEATKDAKDAADKAKEALGGVTVSSDEINRLDGVKSNIQTQLNNKKNLDDNWFGGLDIRGKGSKISFYDTVTSNTGGGYPLYGGISTAEISQSGGVLNVSKGSLQVGGKAVSVSGHTHPSVVREKLDICGTGFTNLVSYINFYDNPSYNLTTGELADGNTPSATITHQLGTLNVSKGSLQVRGVEVDGRRLYIGEEAIVGVGTSTTPGLWTLVPSTHTNEDMQVSLGTTENPFYKVNTDRLEVHSAKPIFAAVGSGETVSSAANMHVSSGGTVSKIATTSSKTIKHDIDELKNEDIKAERLYDLPVHQAKYNENILENRDSRYLKDLPMFIIEEMNEVYPIAVDKPSDNVKEWSWNSQYLIPPMLKLIQEQNERIKLLEEKLQDK